MKTTSWICWLLAVCICLAEAKNKIRRPLPPPYPNTLILKKPRPIGHRVSMGNTIHIGGSLSHQRVPYKHVNYRIRRPAYNISPIGWKNQMSIRATLNNRAVLPQRAPVKEFHSVASKVPEYSPEYRPEIMVLPATHRGSIDDDKGPIHTIPAPNLSPADKPYNAATNSAKNHHLYSSDLNYRSTVQNPNIATIGLPSQRVTTSSSPPQHQYEVTESNDMAILREHQTVQPTVSLQSQDLDVTRLYSMINPHVQSNEIFLNHPVNANNAVTGTNVQFGQSNLPMQTNLHGSLHVGFPSAAIQTPYAVAQQIPELHVGHPAPAGPPLSATQLYDLLNNFPHKVAEQYTPDQQHIFQQQLGQIFQPDAATSFSQPQMHSFNYDEQANQLQQQQQQGLLDQDYVSESVTADYNLDPESSIDVIHKQNDDVHANMEFSIDGTDQFENNIEYEETSHQRNPTTYFKKVNDRDAIPTKFYTTLPNRETAEKLAALAAAGNVNSRLIGQLRKQQERNAQNDESMPSNHKSDDSGTNQQRTDSQLQQYDQYKLYKNQQHHRKQNYKGQDDEKLPLQIMIPDDNDYVDDQQSDIRKDNMDMDMEYEYENDDGEIEDSQSSTSSFNGKVTSHDSNSHAEFGSRLRSKTRE